MSAPYSRQEKTAGFFFLAGLLLIFLGAVVAGGGQNWFQSYNNYYALYNDGYGLSPGVKVKFLRTDVGLVTRLELTDNDKVKVHMSILNEYAGRIKSDSMAAIASPTLIGSEYIDIMPGTSKANPIPKGGQIPAVERKSLEDYVKDLHLDAILARFEATMVNVESLTHQLQDPSGPLMGALSDIRILTASVAAGDGTIGQLVVNDEALRDLQKILVDIQKATGDIVTISGSLGKSLPPVMNRIGAITSNLEKGSRSIPDTARRINSGVRSANEVLDSVKRNVLIRGNIQKDPPPESQTRPARQERP